MLKRIDIVGNPNVGVFVLATDNLAIVPYNLLDEKADIIKETLDVEVVKSRIKPYRIFSCSQFKWYCCFPTCFR